MSDDDDEITPQDVMLAKKINQQIGAAIKSLADNGYFLSGLTITWFSTNTFGIDYHLHESEPEMETLDAEGQALLAGFPDPAEIH